ncbi:hypothetical protein TNCV_4190021 [Trichonephila clavipes]|nr:hypothetical protein TNCV_4190021 [Trichonephila clavipes]
MTGFTERSLLSNCRLHDSCQVVKIGCSMTRFISDSATASGRWVVADSAALSAYSLPMIPTWLWKKCPGVRARISAGSLESGTRDLELMHASIWHNRVDSSSKLRRCPLQVLRRCLLANLIEDSQRPPNLGA